MSEAVIYLSYITWRQREVTIQDATLGKVTAYLIYDSCNTINLIYLFAIEYRYALARARARARAIARARARARAIAIAIAIAYSKELLYCLFI